MKKLCLIGLILLFCQTSLAFSGGFTAVSMEEARNVGENWIQFIIHKQGQWGIYKDADIFRVEALTRGQRCLGYICHVEPAGCIVVTCARELSPIKYYSERQGFDGQAEKGMAGLVKDGLFQNLDGLERNAIFIQSKVHPDEIADKPDPYEIIWTELTADPVAFRDNLVSGVTPLNYSGSETYLLSTSWDQDEPYNAQCPDMGCTWTDCGSNTNALVGCPSTALSQVMKYWGWPPLGTEGIYFDTYDWSNMPGEFNGCTWDQTEVDAVAELCREVGIAFNSYYGCDATGGRVSIINVLPYFRYSNTAVVKKREDYPAQWDAMIVSELNQNRPIYYHVPGHQIVIDGWRDFEPGPIRKYHCNYGWNNSRTGWYEIDSFPLGDADEEAMAINVFPVGTLGSTISGTYPHEGAWPYRYFDRDAMGTTATFESGQRLQFLHNIVVKGSGLPGTNVVFYGSYNQSTYLFSRGDQFKGIHIHDGCVKLKGNGGIRFY